MMPLANLETVAVDVPASAIGPYEWAVGRSCTTVGIFVVDEALGIWRVEGLRAAGDMAMLQADLGLAAFATGVQAPLRRLPTPSDDWLARVYAGFPEQIIGRRFAVRGTHVNEPLLPGRRTILLDAGLAFGSGEHGSTRGCLRALEALPKRPGLRILDLGCGSGILAMAAILLLKRPVLATDIDPAAVAVTRANARLNAVHPFLTCFRANGWCSRGLLRAAPFDLVFANILARPLSLMAHHLARGLAPGGRAVLAGLLRRQRRQVIAAHRRHGLVLRASYDEGEWTALVMQKPGFGNERRVQEAT
jgi:ribosomal protein L11 methyltransferase